MALSRQATLAAAAVAGYALGKPYSRRLVGIIPGLPTGELSENAAGAVAAILAYLIVKRFVP